MVHQVGDVPQHVLGNDIARLLPAHLLANHGEIFWCDMQPVGIVGHGTRPGIDRFYQVQETLEKHFPRGKRPRTMLHHPSQDIPHVVNQSQHYSVYHFLFPGGRVLRLGTKQIIILTQHLGLSRLEMAHRIVLEKKLHVPEVFCKRKYPLDIGRRDAKAMSLEVSAFRATTNDTMGRTNEQVIPFRLISLAIEQQSCPPLCDKRNGEHLQLDGVVRNPTAVYVVEESQFPIIVYHVVQIGQAGQVRFFHLLNTLSRYLFVCKVTEKSRHSIIPKVSHTIP